MAPTIYVGIDNGITGAVAFLFPCGLAKVYVTPTTNRGTDTVIDDIVLRDMLLSAGSHVFVTYERTNKNPIWGCKGNFSNGINAGIVRTTLRQMGLPNLEVHGKEWQSTLHQGFRVAGLDTKKASFAACAAHFPDVSLLPTSRSKNKHSGMADALLIAKWGKDNNL